MKDSTMLHIAQEAVLKSNDIDTETKLEVLYYLADKESVAKFTEKRDGENG